jgi:hypothetical protein
VILPRQRFDLDRKPHRLRQRRTDGDHAVMFQEAGEPAFERGDGMIGELLRAERRIGRAADGVTAGTGDHVVYRRNFQAHDGENRRIGRMGMNHRVHVRPCLQNVEVESPLARRALRRIETAVEPHIGDLLGLHRLIGHARRRDQHPGVVAQADIARCALIDAQRIHAQAGVDDGLALFPVICGEHQFSPDITAPRRSITSLLQPENKG